jgi:hypothetical protein
VREQGNLRTCHGLDLDGKCVCNIKKLQRTYK